MEAKVNFVSAQFVTRLLIVSYFVALALNLIEGAEIARFAEPLMPGMMAHYTMRFVVLTLSAMVLFDFWQRPAALVLAIIVFWSSYITLYSGGEISSFWRDLALIGALLLTANIASYDESARDDEWDEQASNPSDGAEADNALGDPIEGDASSEAGVAHVLFREDFDIVRAN